MIDIALCFDSGLQNHIWNCYNSIISNTKESTRFHFLIDKSVNNKNIIKYKDKDINVYIIDVDVNNNFNDRFVSNKAMYYRFKIPEIIDADKCIYAEADSIFDFDVKEYWNIDIGNNYFAAVRDWFWFNLNSLRNLL